MPLRNRVTPYGEIVATPSRGTMLGNRGRLHDEHRNIVREWRTMNWVTCVLRFRGRHRQVMGPRTYTELFFLDEVTALAAGHRPCAECRNADYRRFKRCWARATGATGLPYARDMDVVMARDRRAPDGSQVRHEATRAGLPDGTMIRWRDEPWLLLGDTAWRWTFDGYRDPVPIGGSPDTVTVLTPRCTVAVLRAGYRPAVHDSAHGSIEA